jgi:sugar PTS system EIIA component
MSSNTACIVSPLVALRRLVILTRPQSSVYDTSDQRTEEHRMSATPVLAPVKGRAVPMEQVPDPVFAQLMTGPGAAVDPAREVLDVVAPVSGKLFKLYPHAFVVLTPEGVAVLVHLGIDTVQLEGEGFTTLVTEGDELTVGQPVTIYDVPAIEAAGRNPIVPVIALDKQAADLVLSGAVGSGADLTPTDTLFTVNG